MAELDLGHLPSTRRWSTASTLDDFPVLCCQHPHVSLLSDPESLSLTNRLGGIGPLAIGELVVGSDMALDCGDQCTAYRINVLRSGRMESVVHRSSITARAGGATLHPPRGQISARWAAGSTMLAVKIDRSVVDDALGDALGRQVTAQIEFQPTVAARTGAAASWLTLLLTLAEELFRPNSLLTRPLVGLPIVESLVRGLLLVADHPYRDQIAAEPKSVDSRCVRTAIDIIAAEAHLPLTVSALAARSYVSVRSLQEGFQRHLGTSPTHYLRQVRLRRAHEALRKSDPSIDTVASIASKWGFTNLGRFAAAHRAKYGESPGTTLRRTGFRAGGRQAR